MAFNPLQNFNQGFDVGQTRRDAEFQKSEEARLRQQRESALSAGQQSEAFKQLVIDQPNFAFATMKSLGTDEKGLGAIIEDSAMLKHLLETDPSGNAAMQLLNSRKEAITGSFGSKNSFHTDRAITVLQNEGPQALLANVNAMLDIPGQLKGVKQTNFAPEISPVQTDPTTGQKFIIRTDKNTQESTRIDVEGAMGESLPKTEQRLIRRELLKDASAESKNAFKSLKTIKQSLGTMDEAIAALDKGASTGVMESFLPSFRQSTIELENAANRMGLDVVSATTFGALSEGELKLAMSTALPTTMKPKALKGWLVDRKKAKQKLARELNKMAISLGKGKTTIAEYLERNATFSAPFDDGDSGEFSGFKVVR